MQTTTTRTGPPGLAPASRRQFLLGLGALGLPAGAFGRERPRPRGAFELALLGQCLIRHDLRQHPWPGFAPLARRLRAQHASFTAFEVVIRGARAGAPTRGPETLHWAEPAVIDCLRDFGITAAATAGNHAYDLGTGGILDTLDALRERGLAVAGTGLDLAQAAAPAFQSTPAGRLAIVAAAAGMIRDGGAATATRAGVHELRRGVGGGLDADDVERMLGSIRVAARDADLVLACLHNHYWEPEVSRTSEWQREFARRCVDAGAHLFVAHGAPLLHGIEMHRGAPLFHCLGSFVFQTRKAPDAYGEPNWESLVVECRFERGRFRGAELRPVELASVGARGLADLETRGRPSLAGRERARATLARVAALSSRLGHRLRTGRDGTLARLSPD